MSNACQWIRNTNDGVEISVKIVPGASRDRIAGPLGDKLKILTSAPPEKGRANYALLALVANRLGVPIHSITLLRGMTSPHKVLRIHGLTADSVIARLLEEH